MLSAAIGPWKSKRILLRQDQIGSMTAIDTVIENKPNEQITIGVRSQILILGLYLG